MIGTILKNVRKQKGISQVELGRILSLADTTISSYERGNSQPDFETILKILNACDYDLLIIDKDNNLIDLDKFSREK